MKPSVIERVPGKAAGRPVFVGTRVPIINFFAELKSGNGIEFFLKNYPTVTEEQLTDVLEEAIGALIPDDYDYKARHGILDDDDAISEQDILEKLDSLRDDIGEDLKELGRIVTEGFEELKGKKKN